MADSLNAQQKSRIRLASIVIVVTMPLWLGISFLGGKLGVPPRFAFLSDFAALAAFIFALVVLVRVWRQRRNGES